MSVHRKTGSFKRFIHAVLICSQFFRRLNRITFEVHKNPIFAFFQALLVPTLKPGVLQAITRVSEERTFSHGERRGCGLAPTQVTEEEAHLRSGQQRGLQEAAVDAGFQELCTAYCYAL